MARLFSREAVMAIHRASRGIPRTISVICDNALLTGYAMDKQPVGAAIIDEVCADLDLGAAQQAADDASESPAAEPTPGNKEVGGPRAVVAPAMFGSTG